MFIVPLSFLNPDFQDQKIEQYNYIKQTTSSAFKVLSRDRVSSIPFKMQMLMLSWDPSLGFMQYLEHLKFLEYLLGVEYKGGRNGDGRRSIFDVI